MEADETQSVPRVDEHRNDDQEREEPAVWRRRVDADVENDVGARPRLNRLLAGSRTYEFGSGSEAAAGQVERRRQGVSAGYRLAVALRWLESPGSQGFESGPEESDAGGLGLD